MGATLAPANNKAAFATAKATLAGSNGLGARNRPPSPTFRVAPMQRAELDSNFSSSEAKKNSATM